jgi:hypothetical protein
MDFKKIRRTAISVAMSSIESIESQLQGIADKLVEKRNGFISLREKDKIGPPVKDEAIERMIGRYRL